MLLAQTLMINFKEIHNTIILKEDQEVILIFFCKVYEAINIGNGSIDGDFNFL